MFLFFLYQFKADIGPAGEPGPHGSDAKALPASNIPVAAKSAERTAEEKLARDFHVLFRDVNGAYSKTYHFCTFFVYLVKFLCPSKYFCVLHEIILFFHRIQVCCISFSEAFNRLGMPPVREISPSSAVTEAEVMDITLSTDEVHSLAYTTCISLFKRFIYDYVKHIREIVISKKRRVVSLWGNSCIYWS